MKINEKLIQKDVTVLKSVLDPSWDDFGWILGANLGVQGGGLEVPFGRFFGSWGQDGAQDPPRHPQTPPRPPTDPPGARFLIDFG